MKKVFFLLLLIGFVFSGWCYQESVNSSHSNDGDCNFNFSGNYSISNSSNSLSNVSRQIYINYSKPSESNLLYSIWNINTGDVGGIYEENLNISIPSDCFSLNPIQLYMNYNTSIDYYCKNSSGWKFLYTLNAESNNSDTSFVVVEPTLFFDGNKTTGAYFKNTYPSQWFRITSSTFDISTYLREEGMYWYFIKPLVQIIKPINNTYYNYSLMEINISGYYINNITYNWNGTNKTKNYTALNPYYCYQETATLSTDCGGLSNGSYAYYSVYNNVTSTGNITTPNYFYDENWSTYSVADIISGTPNYAYFFTNYSKPATAQYGSILQVKTGMYVGGEYRNITIPLSCWNNEKIQLVFESMASSGFGTTKNGKGYCWNTTNWINFYNGENLDWNYDNRLYEEAMYWYMPIYSTTLENITFNEGSNTLHVWGNGNYSLTEETTSTFTIDTTTPQNVTNYMSNYDFYIPKNVTFYCAYNDTYGDSASGEVYWANGTYEIFNLDNITSLTADPIIFAKNKSISQYTAGINNWTCTATDYFGKTNTSTSQQFNTSNYTTSTTTNITTKKVGLTYGGTMIGYDLNYSDYNGTQTIYFNLTKTTNHTAYGNASNVTQLYRDIILDTNKLRFISVKNESGSSFGYILSNITGYLNIDYNVTFAPNYTQTRIISYSIPITLKWSNSSTYRYVNITNERIITGKYLTLGIKPPTEWNASNYRINIEVYYEGSWLTLGTYSTCEETNLSGWGVYNIITWDSNSNGYKDSLNLSIDLNSTFPKVMRFSVYNERESPCGDIIIPPTPPSSGGGTPSGGGGGTPIEPVEVFKKLPSETEIKETFVNIDNVLKQMVFGIPLAIILGLLGLFYAGYKYLLRRIDTYVFMSLIGGLTLIISYINLVR